MIDAPPTLVPAAPGSYPTDYDWYELTAPTSHRPITRTVLRRVADGPPVILVHEVAGVNAGTVAIGDALVGSGFTVSMPVLIGDPAERNRPTTLPRNMIRMCLAREFDALVRGRRGPIVDWLMALARAESALSGGRRVGVIGMCFSGSFALATVLDPIVGAAVACQPALPIPFRHDLGLSREEVDTVRERSADGACIRAVRYRRDLIAPRARLEAIEDAFPRADIDWVPTTWPRHSTLRDGVLEPDGPAGGAAARTIAFLRTHLTDGMAP